MPWKSTTVPPEIDTFVFITSDSDMIPIMSRLMYKGKHVHLFYIEGNTSHYQDISRFCHVKCDLLSLFEINPKRKNPEYWKDDALNVIADWYSHRKSDNMLLGGKWLNRLFCEKLHISSRAASRLICYLQDHGYICETRNCAGHSGYCLNSGKKTEPACPGLTASLPYRFSDVTS